MKNKTAATWLTLVTGPLGLHRLYLFRRFDVLSCLQLIPTLLGLYGVLRAREFGVDDQLSWLLAPCLGLSVAASSLTAIVYGLMDAEKWNNRFNPGAATDDAAGASGWLTVGAVVIALLMGATVLLSSISVGFQRYFEYQAEQPSAVAMTAYFKKSAG
ncbi:hypothetical protein DIC66_10010 [Rhodoferax lacus]|uniref:TM2 domain-containing protein n=1 Tax=Rhodoferax lacus TaxID=2184758 RepID=A0A3E1RBU7_9BURK|nr:hypothetical protein [Rhodoferax lacus]RFO96836.1 hypothetical protein DIC66_10010 [Rhodoferax lacus]